MKIKAIGFVAIPVTDIQRARSFYEGVLGLNASEEMAGGMDRYRVGRIRGDRECGVTGRPKIKDGRAFEWRIPGSDQHQDRGVPSRRAFGPAATWRWCRTRTGTDDVTIKPERKGARWIKEEHIPSQCPTLRGPAFYRTLELKPATNHCGAWVDTNWGDDNRRRLSSAWPVRDGTTVAARFDDIEATIGKLKGEASFR